MHANLHINAISRSQNRSTVKASAYRSGTKISRQSVVAKAAYRAGEKLKHEEENKTHDYTRKGNIIGNGMLVPAHAGEWAKDRESFWNAVENREKRKDALLAKEAVLTLPRNLSAEQQKQVVEGWAKENLVERRGLVVDYAIHAPDASDGEKNFHAHVLYYPRPIAANGEFANYKLTGYKTPNTVDGTKVLREFRFSYQDHLNKASASNDNNQIVFDLRSYREKGINRKPQPKMGPKVTYWERRGYRTRIGQEVKKVKHYNTLSGSYRRHIATYQKIGGSAHNRHAHFADHMREDVANTYYDIIYGDGTQGSFDRDNPDGYER